MALSLLAMVPFPSWSADLHPTVSWDESYDLGFDSNLKADVFMPDAHAFPGPRPAVLIIHGGCFKGGSRKEQALQNAAWDLTARGFAAASIEYRFSTQAKYPAAIIDSQQALRWLRANASRFNIDPNQIGAFGESAGGYLASMLGLGSAPDRNGRLDQFSARAAFVIDFYGRADFTVPQGPRGEDCPLSFLGTSRQANPKLFWEASLLSRVSANAAPTFIVQGDRDDQVQPEQSWRFGQSLGKAGVPNFVAWAHGRGHGFHPSDEPGIWAQAVGFILDHISNPPSGGFGFALTR